MKNILKKNNNQQKQEIAKKNLSDFIMANLNVRAGLEEILNKFYNT